jgi:hypothetical protein
MRGGAIIAGQARAQRNAALTEMSTSLEMALVPAAFQSPALRMMRQGDVRHT